MNDTSSGQNKIALAGVTESFNDNHVLKGIDLEVHAGESLELIGLSGSGKTVALKCVIGLMNPDAGSIRIDGRETAGLSEGQLTDELARTGMLFQHSALFDSMTIWQNITFRLSQTRDISDQAAREFAIGKLTDVGLTPDVADLFPAELSGGMQQRVGLARAMAVDPEILMFDEPFSALDPLIRREMQDELLNIQAEVQKTMMFITHDFLEAIKMGDRIAIMKDGVVVQIGTSEEIVTDPVDSYVREFTEDVPRYKVLSVGKVMRVASDAVLADGTERVNAHAKLDSLIDIATQCDGPLAVVDDENEIIGEIDQAMILKAMDSRS